MEHSSYTMRFVRPTDLTLAASLSLGPGAIHAASCEVLHDTLSHENTVTLFCQGPRVPRQVRVFSRAGRRWPQKVEAPIFKRDELVATIERIQMLVLPEQAREQ